MFNTIKKRLKAISISQWNAKKIHKLKSGNDMIVEREEIPNTPFYINKNNKKWFLTMGDYRITEPNESKSQTLEKAKITDWLTLFTVIATIQEKMLKEKGLTK